jgi:hypothetical protein
MKISGSLMTFLATDSYLWNFSKLKNALIFTAAFTLNYIHHEAFDNLFTEDAKQMHDIILQNNFTSCYAYFNPQRVNYPLSSLNLVFFVRDRSK